LGNMIATPLFLAIYVALLFFFRSFFVMVTSFLMAIALAALLRSYVFNKVLPVPSKCAVLITGCSSGIGEHAALRFAEMGFLVFAGVRKVQDAENLKAKSQSPNNLHPITLDVTDQKQIDESVEQVKKRLAQDDSRLLALINNAGYTETGPLELLSLSALRSQFEVNVFGQIAVTQAYLPLLRQIQSPHTSRIVFVSSGVGKMTFPGTGAYSSTKHALEALNDAFRMELQKWKIDVICIEPGHIATSFADTSQKGLARNLKKPAGMDDAVFAHYAQAVQKARPFRGAGAHVEIVTKSLAHALLDSKPLTRYIVGKEAFILPLICRLPDVVLDLVFGSNFR